MGRVYDIRPKPGELDGDGCKVFALSGDRLLYVFRVEFDADADEGMATVHAHVTGESGDPLPDYDASGSCKVSFRTYVAVVRRGEPVPRRAERLLYKNPDGTLTPSDALLGG